MRCNVCGGDSNDRLHKNMARPVSYYRSKHYISHARKPIVKCTRCGGDTKLLDDIEDCYPNPITLTIGKKDFCDWCHMAMVRNNEIDWAKGKWTDKPL